ncbi:MAG: hypothetical protein ACTTK0_04295 [Stomatobaculum sp.]
MGVFQKLAAVQAGLLAVQTMLYFGVEALEGKPHNVESSWDRYIPFVPGWIFVYILWFPLIALYPLALFRASAAMYGAYIAAIAADIVLSLVCYLAYPTSFQRPLPPDTAVGRVVQAVYRGSYRGLNCAPSMHCSMCYLIIVTAFLCPALSFGVRVTAALLSFGIVLSTLYTKQHVLIDVLSALPLAAICWGVGVRWSAAPLLRWLAG